MLFDKQLAEVLENEQISAEEILGAFEVPKDSKMGDICLPCFKFSRTLRKAPPQIASDLSKSLEGVDFIEKVDVVGGYLNIHLNRKAIAGTLIELLNRENIGLFPFDSISSAENRSVSLSSICKSSHN